MTRVVFAWAVAAMTCAIAAAPAGATDRATPSGGPARNHDLLAQAAPAPDVRRNPVSGTISLPQPLILDASGTPLTPGHEPILTTRMIPSLDAVQLEKLRTAQRLRQQGLLQRAIDIIDPLLIERPHHAILLYERARLHVAQTAWEPLERLARTERAATQDSLLLTRELVLAYERLGRPREGASTALECWIAGPAEGEWAFSTLVRLAAGDPRGVRELMRRTAERFPARADLVRGHARLEWKLGDPRAAMSLLDAADGPGFVPALRWNFADELLRQHTPRDSGGAADALLSMAGDARVNIGQRLLAARRAWDVAQAQGQVKTTSGRVHHALKDVPPEKWHPELLVGVARGLREAGRTTESRALLDGPHLKGPRFAIATLERALADLRDGPAERALPALREAAASSSEARYRYAEALFFAGMAESAKAVYQAVSTNPDDAFAGAALERIYLIEDGQPASALAAFGRIAWHDWRGDDKVALALGDTLFRSLSPGPLWARLAVFLSERREAAGLYAEAVAAVLALAERLPGDRLAPLARQRAGDLYAHRLKDAPRALAQYEECLTLYPRAWNSADVRRKLEALRKQRF